MLSAIEGWNAVCAAHQLDRSSTSVSWIYRKYSALLHKMLSSSRRLHAKGLAHIVAGLVLLCYGGVHAQRQLFTPSLFHSLTYAQCWLTTWFCKQDTAGDEHFFFHH